MFFGDPHNCSTLNTIHAYNVTTWRPRKCSRVSINCTSVLQQQTPFFCSAQIETFASITDPILKVFSHAALQLKCSEKRFFPNQLDWWSDWCLWGGAFTGLKWVAFSYVVKVPCTNENLAAQDKIKYFQLTHSHAFYLYNKTHITNTHDK